MSDRIFIDDNDHKKSIGIDGEPLVSLLRTNKQRSTSTPSEFHRSLTRSSITHPFDTAQCMASDSSVRGFFIAELTERLLIAIAIA
ncbi:MAG: hypothetical protein F6K11_33690 [Leptolyngbya sp. SIO3F4]|nr:hypothetical protein [Leptolyngbya sp. SIO3F4]